MIIQENISLKPFNSFGIDVSAKYFSILALQAQLDSIKQEYVQTKGNNLLVLGGGSNVLFTKPFDGWIVKNELKGIQLISEDATSYLIEAAAGENWHEFVLHCIQQGWAGLENLSLIPGSVGASPIQNIGAYGVEIKDTFHSLDAYHIQENNIHTFTLNDCKFGYRDSIFKKTLKDQYLILKVRFRLNKQHQLTTCYGAIANELEKMCVQEPTIADISNAVIRIRTSKLPDPKLLGNAGSFFKNPVVSKQHYEQILASFPNVHAYPTIDHQMKLAAGWLIEQCGWKGYRHGEVGCHALQALVLVNYGHASGTEILALSNEIIQSIENKFGVILEREVNIH